MPRAARHLRRRARLGALLPDPSSGSRLWDAIWEAGREHGLVAGGYKAIDSLRLEKGYRVWGADITPDDTPYEAGLGFAVKLDKGDFIGRDALLAAGEPERRLCCLVLDDPRAVALGSEPVRVGGRVVGRVTSGGYGYTVARSIAYAYLPAASAAAGTRGRGRDLRRVGRGRGGGRAAVRPERASGSAPRTRLGLQRSCDGSIQLGVGEGLVEQLAALPARRPSSRAPGSLSHRHQHHRQVGEALAQLVEELDAGHVGHDDIAHHQVEALLVEQLERPCRADGTPWGW